MSGSWPSVRWERRWDVIIRSKWILGLLFGLATFALAGSDSPTFGPFGLDLSAQDASVRPGDNFYRYANGHWIETAKIPADRTEWGTFDALSEEASERVRKLIQELPANAPLGSFPQKVGDYYRAYLDQSAINAAGLKPARPALTAIAAARSYPDIATLMGRPDLGLESPIGFGISVDEKNPDRYLVDVAESGLGLPDRDYYLKTDTKFQTIREQYRAHLAKMLSLAGESDTDAKAVRILELETHIAAYHWPRAKRRERDLTYNLRGLPTETSSTWPNPTRSRRSRNSSPPSRWTCGRAILRCITSTELPGCSLRPSTMSVSTSSAAS